MRKIIAIVLTVLYLSALPLYAVDMSVTDRDSDGKVQIVVNTDPNPATSSQLSSTTKSILVPNYDRILAVSVTSNHGNLTVTGANLAGTSPECVAALYDLTGEAILDDSELECEIESDGSKTAEKVFVYPYAIRNGVLVRQGGQTTVMIEYETYGNR